MRPKITEIADLNDISELRFRPSDRAGSAHLMTPSELRAATERARKFFNEGPTKPNRKESLQRFLDEEKKRETETRYDRAEWLRQRIAWELVQEKKEKAIPREVKVLLDIEYGVLGAAKCQAIVRVLKRPAFAGDHQLMEG